MSDERAGKLREAVAREVTLALCAYNGCIYVGDTPPRDEYPEAYHAADRILVALASESEGVEPVAWQPIATAPRGELLLYFPAEHGRNPLVEMTKVDRHPVYYPRKPTHWMPLASPPSTSEPTSLAPRVHPRPQAPELRQRLVLGRPPTSGMACVPPRSPDPMSAPKDGTERRCARCRVARFAHGDPAHSCTAYVPEERREGTERRVRSVTFDANGLVLARRQGGSVPISRSGTDRRTQGSTPDVGEPVTFEEAARRGKEVARISAGTPPGAETLVERLAKKWKEHYARGLGNDAHEVLEGDRGDARFFLLAIADELEDDGNAWGNNMPAKALVAIAQDLRKEASR